MSQILISENTESFLRCIPERLGLKPSQQGFESTYQYPLECGTGSQRVLNIKPGLIMEINDFCAISDMEKKFQVSHSHISFTFIITGIWKVHLNPGLYEKSQILSSSCESLMTYFPDISFKLLLKKGLRQKQLRIYVSLSVFKEMINGLFDYIPENLINIVHGIENESFLHKSNISFPMQSTLHDILHCPCSGISKRLYLESKAMELIALKLDQISCYKNRTKTSNNDYISRTRFAGKVLTQNLENPPSLFELARTVGTTHTRLNRDFKNMFGTTVFGYLRRVRLEKAKQLLNEGKSVTEAALCVGYNSISSFSSAFSQYYGSSPMTFVKKCRHNLISY